ncbi:MAG TPA: dynamin family protein [Kofleriaceae bacterium]|nr:dynamin family protein [Kofleriaceae bacterium]
MASPTDSIKSLWSRLARKAEDTANELLLDGYRDQVNQARGLLAGGDPAGAADMIEALLKDRPDHVGALTLLGAARLTLGDPAAALAAFDRAVAERGDDAHARIGMGEALVSLERPVEAVPHLQRGVEVARGERALLGAAYLALGRAWRAQGELDKAIRELRKAVAESPDDVDARTELGMALLRDERTTSTEARRHLERAIEAEPAPAAALAALGRLALADGLIHSAAQLFERARVAALATHGADGKRELTGALVGLGDVALALREPNVGHQRYLEALELEPRRAATHARLAVLHRTQGDLPTAVAAYERALSLGAGKDVLADAVVVAHAAGDRARAVRWANDLLAIDATSPIALAARAAELIDAGAFDAAAGLLAAAPRSVEIAIEEARLARARTPGAAGAAAAARAALVALEMAPDDTRARKTLAEARADQLAIPESVPDDDRAFPRLAASLERVLATRADLAPMVGEVARATAELEQPLLVTVMGEFSSGKSSFVNAFIGADVAATGITPTTATINVVKYGHTRGGCIHGRDGSVRELAWDELHPYLRGLTPAAAAEIDRVEILLPLDHLTKVHLVDTPGLNSILPEHEETARAFIARADAVVWVFTAGQGGKASERKALDAIRAQGKRVLGVLNKQDQLSASEVTEVVDHVRGELADRVEIVVPFSARRALTWKRDATGDDGNWAALSAALEERFFAQARQIKRAACARRLLAVTNTARAAVEVDRQKLVADAAALHERVDALADAAGRAPEEVVAPVRRELAAAVDALYRRAAREVIELVRPRQLPFGSHSATPADRDYLLAMLDDGYEAMLLAAEQRVMAETRSLAGVDALRLDTAALLRPLAHARAYVSGFLAGGAVDAFFRNDLPRLALDGDSAYHALFRAAPDLERLVATPLALTATTALTDVGASLARRARAIDVALLDLDVGLGRALDQLSDRFGS